MSPPSASLSLATSTLTNACDRALSKLQALPRSSHRHQINPNKTSSATTTHPQPRSLATQQHKPSSSHCHQNKPSLEQPETWAPTSLPSRWPTPSANTTKSCSETRRRVSCHGKRASGDCCAVWRTLADASQGRSFRSCSRPPGRPLTSSSQQQPSA